MIASTDCKSYMSLTDAIYRFGPIIVPVEDLTGLHGHDERISIDSYKKGIQFYYQLMKNSDDKNVNHKHHDSQEL